MNSQKCQLKLGQKVHGLVAMDIFKQLIQNDWEVFFTLVQNGFF